jgi:signal transduction histidine kinase
VRRTRPRQGALLLDEVAAELDTASEQLRDLARGIHPTVLTLGGINPALHGLARRSAVPAVVVTAPTERFSTNVEATAYFVVAEALTNAARHAPATRVEIEVSTTDRALLLEVRDDGIGGVDPKRQRAARAGRPSSSAGRHV